MCRKKAAAHRSTKGKSRSRTTTAAATAKPNLKISSVTLAAKYPAAALAAGATPSSLSPPFSAGKKSAVAAGHDKKGCGQANKYILPLRPTAAVQLKPVEAAADGDQQRSIINHQQPAASVHQTAAATTSVFSLGVTSSSSATVTSSPPPNLLFLQPIPEKDLPPESSSSLTSSTKLPPMNTLKRMMAAPMAAIEPMVMNTTLHQPVVMNTVPVVMETQPVQLATPATVQLATPANVQLATPATTAEYYVILNTVTHAQDEYSTNTGGCNVNPFSDDFRPRRDSGGSTGLSFRSLSASPNSSLSSATDMDTSMMDCSGDSLEKHEEDGIPESPTDLFPTIDQLFKRGPPNQTATVMAPSADQSPQLGSMDQMIILDDINQIIGETTPIG